MLSPLEVKEKLDEIEKVSDYVVEYVEECHNLVQEDSLEEYPVVYNQLESRAEKSGAEGLEGYFGVGEHRPRAGRFARNLAEDNFEEAFINADKYNATVLASMYPNKVVDLIKEKWGEDSLEANLTARVRKSVAEDILKNNKY